MKITKLVLVLLVSCGVATAMEMPSKYIEMMEKTITALFEAKDLDDYRAVANTFERIGQAEPDKWHPHYYLSLTHIFMSFQEGTATQKDGFLDEARSALQIAHTRFGDDHSELIALGGFIEMISISIDPASRGPQNSGVAFKMLNKAIELNPQNPRAHYLLASMQIGTAQFFGSDISEACSNLQKAVDLYETEQREYPLDPAWGKEWAVDRKAECE
jgi:tetratricopeptide (TPR) repeat protein